MSATVYINLGDYGAVGDYDDSTNTGTDNAPAYNAALAAALAAAGQGYTVKLVWPGTGGAFAIMSALTVMDGSTSTPAIGSFVMEGNNARIVFPQLGASFVGFTIKNMNFALVSGCVFTGRMDTASTIDSSSFLEFANCRSATVRECVFACALLDICAVSFFACGSITENCRFAGLSMVQGANNFLGSIMHRGSTLWAVVDHCRMHYAGQDPWTAAKGGSTLPSPYIFFGESFDTDEHSVKDCDMEDSVVAVLVAPDAGTRLYHFHMADCAAFSSTGGGLLVVAGNGARSVTVERCLTRCVGLPGTSFNIDKVDRLTMENVTNINNQVGNRDQIIIGSSVISAHLEQVEYDDLIFDPAATHTTITKDGVRARAFVASAAFPSNVLVKPDSSNDEHVLQLGTGDAAGLSIGATMDAADYAKGSVQFIAVASIPDQTTWPVTDANGTTVLFCFYTSSNLGGHVGVNLTGLTTATQVASAFLTALSGAGLALTGVLHAVGSAQVDFTSTVLGEEGNVLWVTPDACTWAAYGYLDGGKKRVRVAELGQEVAIKSDGATILAPGDALTSSGTSAGRVKKTTTSGAKCVGRAMSTAAASADAPVNAIWQKETLA